MELSVLTNPIALNTIECVDKVIDSFIVSQDVRSSSKKLYERTLKQYFHWIESKEYSLENINRTHILQYKEGLLNRGMSSLTVGSYITSVRRFYEWAEANKYYPNVAKGIKTPKRKQQFKKQPLSSKQATDLLEYYQDKALRDYAIVNLLLRTGLRTIEVMRANVDDIIFKGTKRVLLVHGKGRDEKDNFVVLTDKSYEPIERYLSTRDKAIGAAPLFVSTSNNSKHARLSTRSISHMAKEGLKAIGLSDCSYTAHSLRHTAAINILRAGGSLETAQFTLRHSNPATTQIYTHTLNEERRLQNSGEVLLDSMY